MTQPRPGGPTRACAEMMSNVRTASCDDFASSCHAHHRTRGKPSDRLAQARRGAPPFASPPDFTLTTIQTMCTRIPCAPSNTINLISATAFGKLFKPSAACASVPRRDDRFSRTPHPEHRARIAADADVNCPGARQQLPSATSCGLSVSLCDKRALRPHLACSGLLHQPDLTHPTSTGSMQ